MSVGVPPCKTRYRRVEPGDTFYIIARDIGTTTDELVRLNPGVNPDNLQIGTFICVPLEAGVPTGKVPPCDSGFYWVIAPGDTMFSIAEALGVPLQTLLALNTWADPENLLPGDSLCLPRPTG